MTPLTIAEAFARAPHGEHHRVGEIEQVIVTEPVQRLSASSERLLAEMLADEGF